MQKNRHEQRNVAISWLFGQSSNSYTRLKWLKNVAKKSKNLQRSSEGKKKLERTFRNIEKNIRSPPFPDLAAIYLLRVCSVYYDLWSADCEVSAFTVVLQYSLLKISNFQKSFFFDPIHKLIDQFLINDERKQLMKRQVIGRLIPLGKNFTNTLQRDR